MKAPFSYFGGKSAVAHLVWQALGQPKHYIEPCFGSGAVLLNRPDYDPSQHIETVNDKDGFVCNVWRGLKYDPDEVAKWCDWPVNHADLCARRKVLLREEPELLQHLIDDDEYFNPKLAGYWIWAASCWIGSGLTTPNAIPHIGHTGMGVHAIGKIPRLSDAGTGVHAIGQIPRLSDAGTGVHAIGKIPRLSDAGTGVHKSTNQNGIYQWFSELSARLRRVRVVCGDWTRVCGGNWQDKMGPVGIFFDPPYGVTDRDTLVYHHDSTTVAHDVMAWCRERGEIPSYRIVLAGYEEYQELIDNHGWTAHQWKANGGYAHTGNNGQSTNNRHRETLYFSPHCHQLKHKKQLTLF